MSNRNARGVIRTAALVVLPVSVGVLAACSSRQNMPNDSAAARGGATASARGSVTSSDAALVPVRGTIAAVSDTALSITTPTGPQQIHVVAPLRVYQRGPSDLTHVTPNTFVGITSVAQPDGSQRATEIHIFPEELRGTGEGSRPMDENTSGARSTMTNGAVSPSRMTNGNVGATRMTNGSVGSTSGAQTFTVRYQGGQQIIQVPPNVTVTAITASRTTPAVGANVVVLAHRNSAGQLDASAVMLVGPTGK
jgi:hypothetical protein